MNKTNDKDHNVFDTADDIIKRQGDLLDKCLLEISKRDSIIKKQDELIKVLEKQNELLNEKIKLLERLGSQK